MQAIVAALCVILSAHVAGHSVYDQDKTANLKLCKDVLVALDVAAENGVEPTHEDSIEVCRNVYIRAQNSIA